MALSHPRNAGGLRSWKLRRAVYKVQERNYGGAQFLLHPQPQEDELLSSWLVRVALEHLTAPATFVNLYLPRWKNALWASDVDLQGDGCLLEALAAKSGIKKDTLFAMTLRGYEGFLFERTFTKTGATPFVMPLRMRGRRCTFPGLRFCPKCLAEDSKPYFRKKWRLSFSTACPRHTCFLLDRCQACGKPLTLYRFQPSGDFPSCSHCGFLFKEAQVEVIDGNSYGLKAIEQLYDILEGGTARVGDDLVYSILFFGVIHQLSKLAYFWGRTEGLLNHEVMTDFVECLPWTPKATQLTEVRLKEQFLLFSGLMHLFDNYPANLQEYCHRIGVGKTELSKDLHIIPFWYKKVVDRFDQSVCPVSGEEVSSALCYMAKRDMRFTQKGVSGLIGRCIDFRKRQDIACIFARHCKPNDKLY